MPADINIGVGQPGGPDQTTPVIADKAARNRDAAIAQDEGMPACQPCEDAEAVVRKPMAVQVADEPAAPRVCLHPADEPHYRVVAQVMGELRADDVVEAVAFRLECKHVGGMKCDPRRIRCRLACRSGAPWIEIHTLKACDNAVPLGPAIDAPQNIAMAAGNVEQRERFFPGHLARKPRKCRSRRERDSVDACEVTQTVAIVVVVDAVGIHAFVRRAARRKAHARWNPNVSTVRPGPNAMASPSPDTLGARRTRSSTKTSVADDMLPKSRSTSREKRSVSDGSASPCWTASRIERPPACTAHIEMSAAVRLPSNAAPCSISQRRMRPGTWPERCISNP